MQYKKRSSAAAVALRYTNSCTQLNIKKRSSLTAVTSRHTDGFTKLNIKNVALKLLLHRVILTITLN